MGPILHPVNFFLSVLPLLVVRHFPGYYPMQFKGKLMNQTSKNAKKTLILDPILTRLAQIMCLPHSRPPPPDFFFFVSYTSTCSWTLFQTIILYN